MRRIWYMLWPAAFLLGIAAEWAQFGWHDPGGWIPDLAVGWFIIGCGLVAMRQRPESRAGNLMTATGFTWFLGNFATVGNDVVSWAAANALYLHRGPLFHLLLSYPIGRTTSRSTRVAVVFGYAVALVAPLWSNNLATILIAAALLAVSARDHARAVGEARRARLFALRATAAVSLVIGGTALAWLLVPVADPRFVTLDLQDDSTSHLRVDTHRGSGRSPHRSALGSLEADVRCRPGGRTRGCSCRNSSRRTCSSLG